MKSKVSRATTITITLDQDEAEWLEHTMQNPLHGEQPEDEDEYNKEMRYEFLNCVAGGARK